MTISEKLTAVAENQQEVYKAGQKSEYDRFWDEYQQNGSRRNYDYAFKGTGWTNETFKPKYPIIAANTAAYMFDHCGLTDYDFVEKGITLDLSGATSITYIFRYCTGIKRVGVIDATGCKDINRMLYGSSIMTVDKLVVKETTLYDNAFSEANYLENITIEGCVGNTISFQGSPLSKSSIESVISALSSTTTGQTVTFQKAAVDTAFETAEGLADGSTSDAWLELVATKENWTISLG